MERHPLGTVPQMERLTFDCEVASSRPDWAYPTAFSTQLGIVLVSKSKSAIRLQRSPVVHRKNKIFYTVDVFGNYNQTKKYAKIHGNIQ